MDKYLPNTKNYWDLIIYKEQCLQPIKYNIACQYYDPTNMAVFRCHAILSSKPSRAGQVPVGVKP